MKAQETKRRGSSLWRSCPPRDITPRIFPDTEREAKGEYAFIMKTMTDPVFTKVDMSQFDEKFGGIMLEMIDEDKDFLLRESA